MICRAIPYEGQEPYLFLSYCHKDSAALYPIFEQLVLDGYRVWYDDGIRPGDDWPENIASHLEKSSMVLAFVSENASISHNCKSEISFAIELEKPLIPILLEPVQMPLGMRMQLSLLQYVALYQYPSPAALLSELYKMPQIRCCQAPEARSYWRQPEPDIPEPPVEEPEIPEAIPEPPVEEPEIPEVIPELPVEEPEVHEVIPEPPVEEPEVPEVIPEPPVEEPEVPEIITEPPVEEPEVPEIIPEPPVEEPVVPEIIPEPPVEEPEIPEIIPDPPVEEPEVPEIIPEPPVVEPVVPEVIPEPPVEEPEVPEVIPEPPVEEPEVPEVIPEQPVEEPVVPEIIPEPPVEEPEVPEVIPEPPVLEPEVPEVIPEPPVEEPEIPEIIPEWILEEPEVPEIIPEPPVVEPEGPEGIWLPLFSEPRFPEILREPPVEEEPLPCPEIPGTAAHADLPTGILIHPAGKQAYIIKGTFATLGRKAPHCDIVIPGNEGISKLHATVTIRNFHASIQDEGSKNGTWIDELQLTPGVNVPLSNPAVFRLYDELLILYTGAAVKKLIENGSVELLLNENRTGAAILEGDVLPLDRSHIWPDGTMSDTKIHRAAHAALKRRKYGVYLSNVGPAQGNAIYLGNRRLKACETLPLNSGDRIRIGHTKLDFLSIKIKES